MSKKPVFPDESYIVRIVDWNLTYRHGRDLLDDQHREEYGVLELQGRLQVSNQDAQPLLARLHGEDRPVARARERAPVIVGGIDRDERGLLLVSTIAWAAIPAVCVALRQGVIRYMIAEGAKGNHGRVDIWAYEFRHNVDD